MNEIPAQRRWTRQGIDCLNSGFDCKNCNIPNLISEPCKMRESVMECYRTLGKPVGYTEKIIAYD